MTGKTRIAGAVMALLMLGGCVSNGQMGSKEFGGTLVGAGLGGLLGSQIGGGRGQLAAVALGTLAGAAIGNSIGGSLDNADRTAARGAYHRATAAPVGDTIEWHNPDSGNYGSVTPTREGRNRQTGAYCREYQTTVTVDGREQYAYGTACRQPDGSWEMVSGPHN